MDTIYKILESCEVKKVGERQYEFTASTADIDRDGEVIDVNGWDLKNFKKNPVIMFAHDYKTLPVGKATRIGVKDNKLVDVVEFPPEGTYEFADTVQRLVDTGYLKTQSVGFIPKKWEDGDFEDEKSNKPKRIYTKQELLEISIVPVPSNPNALRNAVEEGIITQKQFNQITEPEIEDKEVYQCECIECGHKLETEKHCKDIKCPKCGGKMRRVERPGQGSSIEDTEIEPILRPYPNEHACRLQNPDKFSEFRRGSRTHEGKKYSVIFGKPKEGEGWEEQAYRYDKDTWQASEARSHCKSHDGNFEAAAPKEVSQAEIIDEIDYLTTLIEKGDLSDEVKSSLQDLAKRIPGGDIPVNIETHVPGEQGDNQTDTDNPITYNEIRESIKRILGGN